MALRIGRGAGRGRLARGRAGAVVLAVALYAAAACFATWPALEDSRTHFLAFGRAVEGRVTPGDHLQTAYNLWLPGHQLTRGEAPWRDPYSFQPEASPRVNFPAWPFALLWSPLDLVLDTVGAWNAFVLLSYVLAGGAAALWLRSLDLRLGAALVGGLVFALAPYRVAQSTGHLLGPVSFLLPLALYGVDTRRRVVTAVALASIPLSGQVHLALGAIPFVALYAVCRRRLREAVPAMAASIVGGVFVWAVSIRGTTGASGRSFFEVEHYSARLGDFLDPSYGGEFERFVYLGRLTLLAALAGLVVLVATRRARLAVALGVGALVPALLALGAHVPGYEQLWRHTPGLHATRVPERLLPIACLALAGLVAVLLDRAPPRFAVTVSVGAALVLAWDLNVDMYRPLEADQGNRAYAALRDAPAGRLLELPILRPDDYAGSVYLYYDMQGQRERPLGYSTTAPKEADALARRLQRPACAGKTDRLRRALDELGVRYVSYGRAFPRGPCTGALRTAPGARVWTDGGVVVKQLR